MLGFILWGLLYLVILIASYIVYSLQSHAKYFKEHNIPYIGPGFVRFVKMLLGQKTFVETELETYRRAVACNSPIVGYTNPFNLNKTIIVTDMETIKNICVKDFDYFINRPPITSGDNKEYISKMLYSMQNEQWKMLRVKMAPMFTKDKIKLMFETFRQSSEDMKTYIKNRIGSPELKDGLDFTHLFDKYTMDVIAKTAFGFDCKTWEVPFGQKSEFEEMADLYQFNSLSFLESILTFINPKMYDWLKLKTMDEKTEKYFEDIIKQEIKQRRQQDEVKNDFLQLMLDLQAGTLKADDENENSGASNLSFQDFDIVANSLQFLLAGFDTTHSVLCFTIYAIMQCQNVQQKLYEEISSKMNPNRGTLTYENLMEMTYLDHVLNESLRMYNPNTQAQRVCYKNYQIPGTDFIMEKGLHVTVPLYPTQHDERYFPKPYKFIPERFTPENKQTRTSYAWNPFGHGLRSCIAMRYAMVKVKAAIAVLVYSFEFSPCARTLISMEFSQAASLKPKGGLWMNVARRI